MATTGWPKFLFKMQESDEFKDLMLKCGGKVIKVNGAIASAQSPVIARAIMPLEGAKVSKMKSFTIKGEKNADAVGCMVQFMHTGNYDVDNNDREGSYAKGLLAETTSIHFPEPLVCHFRVNELAEELQVAELSELSTVKLIDLLDKHWSVACFETMVKMVADGTRCPRLAKALGVLAATHLEDFVDHDILADLKIVNHFALGALQTCAMRIKGEKNLRKKQDKWTWKVGGQL